VPCGAAIAHEKPELTWYPVGVAPSDIETRKETAGAQTHGRHKEHIPSHSFVPLTHHCA
jgi:hypothetical protein